MSVEMSILDAKVKHIAELVKAAENFAENEGLNFTIETASGTLRHDSSWTPSWASSYD